MANNQDLFDLFHRKLREMWFAEKKIHTSLAKMANAAQSDALRAAFRKHEAETQRQIARLGSESGTMQQQPSTNAPAGNNQPSANPPPANQQQGNQGGNQPATSGQGGAQQPGAQQPSANQPPGNQRGQDGNQPPTTGQGVPPWRSHARAQSCTGGQPSTGAPSPHESSRSSQSRTCQSKSASRPSNKRQALFQFPLRYSDVTCPKNWLLVVQKLAIEYLI